MKVSHFESAETQKEVIDYYACNRCENKLKQYDDGIYEYLYSGGYSSKLGDGDCFRFSLCENCLIWLFGEFKIQPKHTVCAWAADENDEVEPNSNEI